MIITTVAKKSDAEKIAVTLINQKLAACVQIGGPITSVYKWKGKIVRSKEWMCLAKSVKRLYPKIESIIKRIHPYKIPEILAMPIVNGHKDYLSWVNKQFKLR